MLDWWGGWAFSGVGSVLVLDMFCSKGQVGYGMAYPNKCVGVGSPHGLLKDELAWEWMLGLGVRCYFGIVHSLCLIGIKF